MDHNPFLKRTSEDRPAKGGIEALDAGNIVWQTRAAPPSEYEIRLADALERVFGDGAETLAAVVEGLNALGFLRPDGRPWDEAGFESEMKRLGG